MKPANHDAKTSKLHTLSLMMVMVQGFADGHVAVIGHLAARRKNSVCTQENSKKQLCCTIVVSKCLSPVAILTRNLGMQTVVNEISKK